MSGEFYKRNHNHSVVATGVRVESNLSSSVPSLTGSGRRSPDVLYPAHTPPTVNTRIEVAALYLFKKKFNW